MFFKDSRPDRRKRAQKEVGAAERLRQLSSSEVPPAKQYELLQLWELYNGQERTFIFDVECFVNYFLVSFKCVETGKVIFFEQSPDHVLDVQTLTYIMFRFLLIGFNSNNYDIPMVMLALSGMNCADLKEASNRIIGGEMRAYDVAREFNIKTINVNHIDLIEVAPITASLKVYGGRLHCDRMQDLPYPHDAWLTREQGAIVRDYNVNDLDVTLMLYLHLKSQIELRIQIGKEYQVDLRSKSDAQIAETIISSELAKLGASSKKPDFEPGKRFKYNVPDFMGFRTPLLQNVLETVRNADFVIGNSGSPDLPQAIADLEIKIGVCTYRMGVGGLHSSEKSVTYHAGPTMLLIDRDVASYYPQIKLNQNLFPPHLGEAYIRVYRALVFRRLDAKKKAADAKKAGELEQAKYWSMVADGLKITINGAFGKLGSPYSKLYAPELLTQVTISGQLCLLMLIEMIELAGIPVLSANTDGIVMGCPPDKYEELQHVIIMWEEITGFVTEETRYDALLSRDVNNYIAVKPPEAGKNYRECKVKGAYSERGSAQNSVLSKNPEAYIVSEAVQAFVANGVPVSETILNCQDFRKFVSVRNVKGGGFKGSTYLGKAVRWYYAKGETGEINYVLSGNKVPKSEGARPCMNLPAGIPDDLDYDRYLHEATETLYDIGYYERPKKMEAPKFF